MWQRNFNIQFDFRTFYPNGVLFVAPGIKEKQKHFITLIIRDGQLTLTVRGRKKEELRLPLNLNDGKWHHVNLNCIDRKVTLSVDVGMSGRINSAQAKIPKRVKVANMMLVGGISNGILALPKDLVRFCFVIFDLVQLLIILFTDFKT